MDYDAEFFVLLGFLVFVGVLIYFGVPRMVLKALDARGDPALVIMARTGAASISGLDDAIARAMA